MFSFLSHNWKEIVIVALGFTLIPGLVISYRLARRPGRRRRFKRRVKWLHGLVIRLSFALVFVCVLIILVAAIFISVFLFLGLFDQFVYP